MQSSTVRVLITIAFETDFIFSPRFCCSLHRHQRTHVRTIQSPTPLQEFEGALLELHLRGWQPRTNLAAERHVRFEFPTIHTRSDRLRVDFARGHKKFDPASAPDHQREDFIQVNGARGRIRLVRGAFEDVHAGITSVEGYFKRQRGIIQ